MLPTAVDFLFSADLPPIIKVFGAAILNHSDEERSTGNPKEHKCRQAPVKILLSEALQV